MKHLFFCIVLVSLISCQEKDSEKSYFNASKLDKLNLENLSEFYGTKELSTYYSPFKNFYGYVNGIGYENSEKGIFVTVFESQEKAIECMQDRIRTVSCVIENGTTDVLEHPWWYSDCLSKNIFKNQGNTIIEVNSSHDNFEEIQDLLINTINEVTARVKDLSE
jgi:hypothetical protein